MSDTSSTAIAPETGPEAPQFEVSVEPMRPGGSNFRTARLHAVNTHLLVVKPTKRLRFFLNLFVLLALGSIAAGIYMLSTAEWLGGLIFTGVGALFLAIMRQARKYLLRTVIFDRRQGVCYVKKSGGAPARGRVALGNIAGLQVIAEWNSGSDGPGYYSYELNLVLDEPRGERFHVMDTGDRQACFDDARTLAAFLDRPLWDQTS